MMHLMQPPHPREPRSDRLVTTRKSCLESDAPFFFPCEQGSGLEGVGTELINAAFDLGGRALPEGELLVELRSTGLDEGKNLVVEELEVSPRLLDGSLDALKSWQTLVLPNVNKGINLAYNDLPGPRQATIKLGRVVDAFVVASNEFLVLLDVLGEDFVLLELVDKFPTSNEPAVLLQNSIPLLPRLLTTMEKRGDGSFDGRLRGRGIDTTDAREGRTEVAKEVSHGAVW